MSLPSTFDPAATRDVAERVLREALADLEQEARQNGRGALFQNLRRWLEGAMATDDMADAVDAVALRRLRQRFRERVNARLRVIEPEPQRRRALRRLLYASFRETGESA